MRRFLYCRAWGPRLGRGCAGLRARQTEKARGALAHRALHLECAPMPAGDLRGHGETQPGATGLPRPVSLDPVKALEEVWEMLRRDRSEERRVGKECRWRGAQSDEKKKERIGEEAHRG